MTPIDYDAIVVGAGPAGASAAFVLGQAGLRTLMIEQFKLPRDKPCGGGLTFKVGQALPFDLAPIIERTIDTIDLTWRLARPVTLQSRQPLVYMVSRSRFDAFLTERAIGTGNVTLIDDCAVESVSLDADRYRVATTQGNYRGRYLVGADGAKGMVGRALGLMRERRLMPAVEYDVEVDKNTADAWEGRMGIDVGMLRGSYGWVFPKEGHLNIGVGCFAAASRLTRRLRQYGIDHLAARLQSNVRVIKRVGYVLPLRRPGSAIQQGRALLVGDAAGLVEAFTGEGIYWAIRSGQLAGQAIVEHIREGAGTGYRDPVYQAVVDRELMPPLLDARRLAHVYLWCPRSCYTLPKRSARMRRAIFEILRGESTFTDLTQSRRLGGWLVRRLPQDLA